MAEKRKIESRKIPESKTRVVSELENLIKNNKTFMICSIKNLPGKQFQEIKKKLRDKVKIKIVKKSLVLRAIDNSASEVHKIREYVKEDSALFFSNLELFELSGILSENTAPVNAKIGQISNEDIVIEPGPTNLVPGPVISELGALGLKIAIEDGKINIKDKKVIVKKGEAVNESAAGLMAKLDVKPFKIGFEPIAAYDNQDKKVYANIKINREKSLDEFKHAYSKALAFAVKLAYPCRESIKFLLAKAASFEKALSNKIQQNSQSGGN